MKRIIVIIVTFFTINASLAQGKAFEKGEKYHAIGMGGQGYWGLGARRGGRTSFAMQYQLEWGIHEYVGLGLHTGLTVGGFRFNGAAFYIPLGLQANFHFYQLIADNVSKNISADKLDIYVGLNIGAGPTFTTNGNFYGALHAGPQFGLRFYPTSNFGIFTEFGYGKTFAQFGFVFR